MLSQSNVFILLILVKHSTLIWYVLAADDSVNFKQSNATITTQLQQTENQNDLHRIGESQFNLTSTAPLPLTILPSLSSSLASNTIGFGGQEYQSDSAQSIDSTGRLPEFPQRSDAIYFVVAVAGGAKAWGRMLARTLIDMGAPFASPQGPPLRPLYVDLPENGR